MAAPGLAPGVTRIGILSDVHANRVALEAVLDDLPAVDREARDLIWDVYDDEEARN
ncbi:MAG: hypothetical protein ABEJ92_09045, partial [Halobacteriales archaeon]